MSPIVAERSKRLMVCGPLHEYSISIESSFEMALLISASKLTFETIILAESQITEAVAAEVDLRPLAVTGRDTFLLRPCILRFRVEGEFGSTCASFWQADKLAANTTVNITNAFFVFTGRVFKFILCLQWVKSR
jgi:hypothetical protein